jgi:uncharacterized protein (TIRG00374 family)
MRRTLIQLVVSLGISAACLFWIFQRLDFAALAQTMLRVHPLYYAAGCALIGLMFWVRALRWRIILRSCGDCPVSGLFSANLIGYMANNILPFRMGEFVRAYTAGQIVAIPGSAALASIVLERVLDGLGLCLAVFITLMFLDPQEGNQIVSPQVLTASATGLLLVFLAVLAVLIGLTLWPGQVSSLLCGLAGRVSPGLAARVEEALRNFQMGLGALRQLSALPYLILYTLISWSIAFTLHFIFLSPLGLPLDPVLAGLAMVGSNLALTIPAAPGYVGTMQMGSVAAMSLAGVPQDISIDYSMIGWAVVYFPITAAGLIEMWRRGMSLGRLKRKASELSSRE